MANHHHSLASHLVFSDIQTCPGRFAIGTPCSLSPWDLVNFPMGSIRSTRPQAESSPVSEVASAASGPESALEAGPGGSVGVEPSGVEQ